MVAVTRSSPAGIDCVEGILNELGESVEIARVALQDVFNDASGRFLKNRVVGPLESKAL